MLIFNKITGEIPRSGAIGQQTINPHDLFYQCSKDSQDFLFGKLRVVDYRDESHLLQEETFYHVKYKLIRCLRITMNLK